MSRIRHNQIKTEPIVNAHIENDKQVQLGYKQK
jgi:hypothetical protein